MPQSSAINNKLAAEIERRRQSDVVGYLLCSDEEIAQEILAEQEEKANPPDPKASSQTAKNQKKKAGQLPSQELSAYLQSWTDFYQTVWGITVDLNSLPLPLPNQQDGFNWPIIVLEGLTPQKVYEKCQESFACWKWTNESLDDVTTENDRDPNKTGSYVVMVRDLIEADPKHKNKSANQLKEKNIAGITLLERLLLELWYYWKNKKHLDIKNFTLCSGSRFSGGGVPGVYWGPGSGELDVHWCSPDDAYGHLRVREVVS